MTLKRLTRNYHNMHKRHLAIGDAMAVISALSKGRSSSQNGTTLSRSVGLRSSFILSRLHIDGCLANEAELTSRERLLHQWRPPIVSVHPNSILGPGTANVGTHSLEHATHW